MKLKLVFINLSIEFEVTSMEALAHAYIAGGDTVRTLMKLGYGTPQIYRDGKEICLTKSPDVPSTKKP